MRVWPTLVPPNTMALGVHPHPPRHKANTKQHTKEKRGLGNQRETLHNHIFEQYDQNLKELIDDNEHLNVKVEGLVRFRLHRHLQEMALGVDLIVVPLQLHHVELGSHGMQAVEAQDAKKAAECIVQSFLGDDRNASQ